MRASTSRAATPSREPAPPTHELEDLGPPTVAQIEWLLANRRIKNPETLERVGACVTSGPAFRDRDSGEWRVWRAYLALPTLADGGRKLWGPQGDGRLFRANVGPVSLFVSPDLRAEHGRKAWRASGTSKGRATRSPRSTPACSA